VVAAGYDQQSQVMHNNWLSAFRKFEGQTKKLQYYEQHALQFAANIITAADKKFTAGDINYLEWVMQTNQAISIQSGYIDAIAGYNESIIELNYLTSNL
jgi:cobalt-zinc-cadmium resistance protein CzcA